ncbi:hypothetical protein KI387_006648 [Taxus chinensis]|uniref:Serine aminopeptidase S33 domain-containing protein n=1 Tax=Taxus chinensis TaxID=29808 RepID=A0AA38GQX4_TAXCH|nr:hypothetical protein KI387_006648 [Taxus chinensis]
MGYTSRGVTVKDNLNTWWEAARRGRSVVTSVVAGEKAFSVELSCIPNTYRVNDWGAAVRLLSARKNNCSLRPSCRVVDMAAELAAGEIPSDVIYEEEFIMNSRGLQLFTCRWLPANREAKALIFLCHGYGMECSIFMQDTGVRLAKAGYAVFGIDYEGHGKSAGMHGYVKSFQNLVDDCAVFFTRIAEKEEYKKKARFLYGESMGGAVLLLIHRKQPNFWSGAVLVAPMCKIADDLKPHPLVISILNKLIHIIPTWKIVPTQDIVSVAFKDPEKRQWIRANPYIYEGRPRLKTGFELLMTSIDIEKRLDEVTLPFMVLHGEDDKVTDPSVSELLYSSAKSLDKTLKLYPDMWHGLTCGEPPEHTELVFSDIISWLDKRSTARSPDQNISTQKSNNKYVAVSMTDEIERKLANDNVFSSER